MRLKSIVLGVAILLILALTLGAIGRTVEAAGPSPAPVKQKQEGCLACHEGIEPIREEGSGMLAALGGPGSCTICHGGNPDETEDKEKAHSGAPADVPAEDFYPDPGSIWIADKTCGQPGCHVGYPYRLERALMNTEAGKIQGNMFTWTVQKDHKVVWGNYDVEDTDGQTPMVGTEAYKAYMAAMIAEHPDQFPTSLQQLPNPTVEEIKENPFLAGFTYLRQQCQRCHVGIKGRLKRGDYRGMGCSACHIPYSNEGFYEGNDPTIPKDEPGHPLVHRIQGTREAHNGIPTETCNSCHNRGKRIGVTYQGIMEFPYGSPFNAEGKSQPPLHTKKYLYIKDDLHHSARDINGNPATMLCQDCHTSIDMHGDGNIFGTTLAQVEIECSDCHGTPDKYPWELPLGYGEEFEKELPAEPRGTTTQLLPFQSFGTVYPPEDGYLLTARGNPFGNVVRKGDRVILHSATGVDFEVPLLKRIKETNAWKTDAAEVAMDKVAGHMTKMECYACHADWAPQCYGCHVKVDYSGGARSTDWVAIGNSHTRFTDGLTVAEHPEAAEEITAPGVVVGTSPGEVNESRSYLRWEEPVLGINGEGRVTPLMPGCQVVKTVIGPDGEVLLHNVIGRTAPGTEGGGPEGQRAIDMAPVQPHSAGRKARRCESCHNDPKALGYGIQGGRYQQRYTEDIVVDLENADGTIWPQKVQVQIPAIPELPIDWSQIVTRDGQQLQIVGSHWPLSRPLDQQMRIRMERTYVCMGCHQNMADPSFWNEKVVAIYGRVLRDDDHIKTMNQLIHDAVEAKTAGAAPVELGPESAKKVEEAASAAQSAAETAAAAATAVAEAKNLAAQAKTAAEEAASAAKQAAQAPAPAAPNTALYAIIALIVGLVIGGGGVYLLRRS